MVEFNQGSKSRTPDAGRLTETSRNKVKRVKMKTSTLRQSLRIMPPSLLAAVVLIVWALMAIPMVHAAGAPAEAPETEEMRLLELINEARQNPLDTAVAFGMDRKQVLADNPDIADILRQGLPTLEFNGTLYQTAAGHVAEMLENNFYSYESLDGSDIAGRMTTAGYVPAVAGQSLGLIFFSNYIDPLRAVSHMFENMFKDELAPDYSGIRKILNPRIREMGAAVGKGSFEFPEFSANVYLAACDFARPVETYELQLLNLVNQLRADPRPVLAEHGIDAGSEAFPEMERLFSEGLPPVAYHPSLYAAADELVVDMLENGHFTGTTTEGKTLADRVRGQGYEPAWTGEARVRLSTCETVSPSETLPRMFRSLLRRAFHSDPEKGSRAMLAEEAADTGIRIIAGHSPALGGICGDDVHLLVADFGARQAPEPQEPDAPVDGRLVGLVFSDKDSNGIYDPGEGLPNAAVTIDRGAGSDFFHETAVNRAGGYAISLAPGNYRVTVRVGQEQVSEWVRVESGANYWLPAVIDVSAPEAGV